MKVLIAKLVTHIECSFSGFMGKDEEVIAKGDYSEHPK